MGMTVASIVRKKTIRPPKRSVQMPSGTRAREPDKTGVAAIRPNSVSVRPSCVFSGMPRIANIIQIAKQRVNAKVLDHSTRQARGSAVEASWTALTARVACDLRAAVMELACRLNLRLVKNRPQD